MDRVFLDANVLFSAAYRPDSGLLRLWGLETAEIVTSRYAWEEALRNLDTPERRSRLERLSEETALVDEALHLGNLSQVNLPSKDLPILAAAIACGASHLVTGDRRHFGSLMDNRVEGVLVLTPRSYLG